MSEISAQLSAKIEASVEGARGCNQGAEGWILAMDSECAIQNGIRIMVAKALKLTTELDTVLQNLAIEGRAQYGPPFDPLTEDRMDEARATRAELQEVEP